MKEFLKNKEMPIGAYCSPQPATKRGGGKESRITLQQYKLLKECGVNVVYCHNEVFGTETEKDAFLALDYAKEVGVKCYVRDAIAWEYISLGGAEHGKRSYLTLTDEEKDDLDKRFETSLKRYCNHEAFGGISFWDEPGYDSFDAIARAKTVFERVCPNKTFYVNHFPYYITPEQFQFGYWCRNKRGEGNIPQFQVVEGIRNIQRYDYLYKGFIEKVKPELFSYDAYPFSTLGTAETGVHEVLWEMPQYLSGMERETGVPYWAFLQAGGMWEGSTHVRLPNEAECRLGVSVPLLYGAKGLQLFPYMFPNDWLDDPVAQAGVIGRNGEKTVWYGYYQEIFKHVKAMQSRLMTAKLNAVVSVGKYENGLPSKEELAQIQWSDCIYQGELPKCKNIEVQLPYKSLKSASAKTQCLIGCMENDGKEMYFVVNNSTQVSAEITLDFDNAYEFRVVCQGKESARKTAQISVNLLAGECILIEKE